MLDTTRGGVMNALYQEAAAYSFPGVEQGAEAFMTSVGPWPETAPACIWTGPAPCWRPPPWPTA